jgi:3-oxoacyl-[acyl-carrier-protein] synthase III
MIGIKEIGYFLPERRASNFDRAEEFSLTDSFINNKLGVRSIAIREEDCETSDLCVAALRTLTSNLSLNLGDVDCVVVVTQNPDGYGLPHTSSIVHRKLGLSSSCLTFDIGLGCSGYIAALAIVSSTMQNHGLSNGLLFTADPYSKVIDKSDRNTALLFGDGASVTVLSDDPVWEIGKADFVCTGNNALELQEGRTLHMNGRAVFDFCATKVPDSIRRAAKLNDIDLFGVDRFILHQGSKFIVDTIAAKLKVEGRAPFDAQEYGNTVSSSVPIALVRAIMPEDRNIVISGFGVGLNVATTVLRRAV